MRVEAADDARDLALRWSGQISLTQRILLVNLLALLLLAGAFFYLDSYRSRIVDNRTLQATREARLIAAALAVTPPARRDEQLLHLARDTGARIRLLARSGRTLDSHALGLRNFQLIDPDREGLDQRAARFLDGVIDTVVGAPRPPLYRDRSDPARWREVRVAHEEGGVAATVWRAPDRTPVITAAAPLPGGDVVLTASNARDITQTVRIERFRLSVVLLLVTGFSILLSLFLARTIVRPLRRLARAAVRVRLGRAREVVVPRLPSRRDELGMLARALSDMSLALRARIDATEAFAADVTHELKNPLASLRSAVDGLARVRDPALQAQLLEIVQDDVYRLDRLITDISEASRLDAQLSRAEFVEVDLGAMIAGLLAHRDARGVERGIRVRFEREGEPLLVVGEGARLERVFENLLDNALSFSPDDGLVRITATSNGNTLAVQVEDEGPGVPADARETVFRRFQSIRPETEAFGRHSGLGLAIARTIVEGHGGAIAVRDRGDGRSGACFLVRLPAAEPEES